MSDVMGSSCAGRGVNSSPLLVSHFLWENVPCPAGGQEIWLQKLLCVQYLSDFVGQTVTKVSSFPKLKERGFWELGALEVDSHACRWRHRHSRCFS